MLTQEPKKRSQTSNKKYDNIPDSLIYEVMDGEPLYYRGYKDVLNNKKSLDDIMGSSGLQSFIIQYILDILYTKVGRKHYHFLTNEVGLHLGNKNNLSGDVQIYERSKLRPEEICDRYITVPAKVAVEIDSKNSLFRQRDCDYVNVKTQKLLDFGVEKVIWIFTTSYKVTIARKDFQLEIKDWDQEMELVEGHLFNIAQYLQDEGIKLKFDLL